MFIDVKAPGEAAQISIADQMRRGKEIVGEHENRFAFNRCALGCLLAYRLGRLMTNDEIETLRSSGSGPTPLIMGIARYVGIDYKLARDINALHHQRRWPALMIADWLDHTHTIPQKG
jgi:hypothetical protein